MPKMFYDPNTPEDDILPPVVHENPDPDIAFVKRAIQDYETDPDDSVFAMLAERYKSILVRLEQTEAPHDR